MKAPEKIYLTQLMLFAAPTISNSDKDIEYIRADVFIEKAAEWLKENFLFDEAGYCKTNIYSTESMIHNFKNTLGGNL